MLPFHDLFCFSGLPETLCVSKIAAKAPGTFISGRGSAGLGDDRGVIVFLTGILPVSGNPSETLCMYYSEIKGTGTVDEQSPTSQLILIAVTLQTCLPSDKVGLCHPPRLEPAQQIEATLQLCPK